MRSRRRALHLAEALTGEAVARAANVILAFDLAINFALLVEDAQSRKSAAQVAASGTFCPNRPHLCMHHEHAQ